MGGGESTTVSVSIGSARWPHPSWQQAATAGRGLGSCVQKAPCAAAYLARLLGCLLDQVLEGLVVCRRRTAKSSWFKPLRRAAVMATAQRHSSLQVRWRARDSKAQTCLHTARTIPAAGSPPDICQTARKEAVPSERGGGGSGGGSSPSTVAHSRRTSLSLMQAITLCCRKPAAALAALQRARSVWSAPSWRLGGPGAAIHSL